MRCPGQCYHEMSELGGASILVTGASGGFGKELARQMLDAGGRLILSDREECIPALTTLYGECPAVTAIVSADLAHSDGCDGLFEAVQSTGESPDILINNAGVAFSGRPDLVPDRRIDHLMQINLVSPMRLCRLFLPRMIEKGGGHIVNISSVAGWIGGPGMSAYCASKFGLRGFGEALAADVEDHGIRLSTVYPWFSRTPILDSDQFGPDERRELPDDIVTDPADVVAEILQGIRRNKEHIFPDAMARRVYAVKRFFPWLLPWLRRRLERKVA